MIENEEDTKDLRRFEPTAVPGIRRITIYDSEKDRFVAPERGKRFQAVRRVRVVGKKRKKKEKENFFSFDEAKKWRAAAETTTIIGQTVVSTGTQVKPVTFGDLADRWKSDWLPHKELSTQIRYKSYLNHFKFFWDLPIEMMEPTTIDAWITHLKKPAYLESCHSTRCSYDHEFSVLRGILNYYVERFNRNYRLPFIRDHRTMLKVKEKSMIEKDLTIEEFRAFIKALRARLIGTRWEVIYYLALMQYAIYGRVQDAAALHYEDFDFDRNKLNINKKIQWLRAKGYKDVLAPGSKKNGGKELDMPELAAKVFREWVLKSGVRSGLLFTLDGKIITYKKISYRYDQALEAAGLPFKATHILRGASLTEHYDTCKDIMATKKVAGHANVRSTERYVKIRSERLKQTQEAMDAKLEGIL